MGRLTSGQGWWQYNTDINNERELFVHSFFLSLFESLSQEKHDLKKVSPSLVWLRFEWLQWKSLVVTQSLYFGSIETQLPWFIPFLHLLFHLNLFLFYKKRSV